MESSAILRSFNYSIGTVSKVRSLLERPAMVSIQNSCWHFSSKSHKLAASAVKRYKTVVLSAKTSEATGAATSDTYLLVTHHQALVLEVCEKTEIAELKLKVGYFEMHLKRNVGATKAPLSSLPPTTPPPIPAKLMDVSAPVAAPSTPPKPSEEKASPFANVSFGKSPKLAALEASGSNDYVLVSSPTVGSFRRNRTVKGKKQRPICKEGDVIKEGQVIGYLDQFGTELPVKSDVAGKVLKLLFNDGEAVGYGDPLIAVLPSFHGIK
ncbi:biotin carboxyl carrier protein of acetyl-CoA carboxylase-like isoform X3 [Mangifera indica]|uniref:biotin carboxyl carrier protein of acetyl-CoA carboxylase-like isoform X3 n=1 Tax=Mangifera indica TaxID=29780 RepID=UPI001CFB0A67|nr:biotin carboxyl carrier protein of acetyl-CoA carboxylase-like isoform X3 [Mangifera indica]